MTLAPADGRVHAVEENLLEQLRALTRTGLLVPLDEPDVTGYHSEWDFPLFNAFGDVRFGEDDRAAEALVQQYVDRGRPFLWWSTPAAHSGALDRALRARGAHVEDTPGMHRPLDEPVEVPEVPGLVIADADDDTMPTYYSVLEQGFEFPRWAVEVLGTLLARAEPERFRHVVALLDDEPVGAGTVFVTDGVAGLYNITTLAGARGRGIGHAVTARLLQIGHEQGCTDAVLHATAMGEGVYRRLGFETVCATPRYVWVPSEG